MRDALEFHKLPNENVTNLPHADGVFSEPGNHPEAFG
jgi:hypothetical protein